MTQKSQDSTISSQNSSRSGVFHNGENGRSKQYSTEIVNAVWDKAKKEFGFFFFKRDRYGDIIAKHDYGKNTQYGWEIDLITSNSSDGSDQQIENLQPVHWKNVNLRGVLNIDK